MDCAKLQGEPAHTFVPCSCTRSDRCLNGGAPAALLDCPRETEPSSLAGTPTKSVPFGLESHRCSAQYASRVRIPG